MVRMNLILNAQRTMELELPNVDAKNGQIHDTLLTAVASTSLTDTSCCLGGTPWIPSGHHLPHERLGHQSNMQALGPKKISVSPSTNGNVRSHHRRTGRMNISEKRSLGPTYFTSWLPMARLLLRPPRYCKTYQTFLLDRIVEHAAKERPVVFAIALVTACSRVRSPKTASEDH